MDDLKIMEMYARNQRDILLKESDQHFAFDRLGLTIPTGTGFGDWLGFFKTLASTLNNPWAKYRQALRDIPQQPGFPYDIKWPEKPKEDNNGK